MPSYFHVSFGGLTLGLMLGKANRLPAELPPHPLPLHFLYAFPGAYLESQWNSLQANVRERVRAPFHTAQVTCLMLSLGNQRHACIAFDILLLELIRCLIIINTVFFRCCLLLILPLLLYTLVSFKPSIVFWLL